MEEAWKGSFSAHRQQKLTQGTIRWHSRTTALALHQTFASRCWIAFDQGCWSSCLHWAWGWTRWPRSLLTLTLYDSMNVAVRFLTELAVEDIPFQFSKTCTGSQFVWSTNHSADVTSKALNGLEPAHLRSFSTFGDWAFSVLVLCLPTQFSIIFSWLLYWFFLILD